MRPRRTTALFAAAVCAALTLGACSFGKNANETVPSGRVSHASHSGKPSSAPTPTRTATAPTAVVTSEPPSASASPTETATTDATGSTGPAEKVTTYKHLVVKLPVADDAVPGAPAGFTAYLQSALDADWHKLGDTSGCEKAASIKVERISSLGYAMVARNIDPAIPTCVNAASYAGGYQAILGEKDGTWSQLVGLQDEPSCAQMERLGVPQSIYGKCL